MQGRAVRELAPLLAVLAVVALGLLAVASARWRVGSYVIGAAALLGALLRLGLGEQAAGALAVRGRRTDAAVLLVLGLGVVVLAVSVPAAG